MNNNFLEYSDKEAYRIAILISAYVQGTITEDQHKELDNWVAASDDNLRMFERLTDEKNLDEMMRWMQTVETEKALQEKTDHLPFTKPVTSNRWRRILPYGIAASVILLIGLFVLKPFTRKDSKSQEIVINPSNDIAPGGSKAWLTLSDGRKIILDSAINGELASEGGTVITKIDGQISYENDKGLATTILNNSITIPRGGRYQLVLSDGTRVWLNAESSIEYPVTFSGKERLVRISGEAYFEVAKDAAKPFRVSVNDVVVEVLGTHFNVNGYRDEPFTSITLAEGTVKVSSGADEKLLKPGEQARVNGRGETSVTPANLEEALAWKDGKFLFTKAPVESIMRQVARWYDARIVYRGKPADLFTAELSKDVPVSRLLHFLELTDRVHFKIEDKTIIVSE